MGKGFDIIESLQLSQIDWSIKRAIDPAYSKTDIKTISGLSKAFLVLSRNKYRVSSKEEPDGATIAFRSSRWQDLDRIADSFYVQI